MRGTLCPGSARRSPTVTCYKITENKEATENRASRKAEDESTYCKSARGEGVCRGATRHGPLRVFADAALCSRNAPSPRRLQFALHTNFALESIVIVSHFSSPDWPMFFHLTDW